MRKCNICDKTFSNSSFGGHMSGHARKNKTIHKRYCICKICNRQFKIADCLSNKDIYDKSKLCNNCKKKFKQIKSTNKISKNKKSYIIYKDENTREIYHNYKRLLNDLYLMGDYIEGYNEFEIYLLKQYLIKNNFRCEICNKVIKDLKDFNVDHDHHCLKLRGLLCMHCNTLVGKYENYYSRIKKLKPIKINKNKLNYPIDYNEYRNNIILEYKKIKKCPYCNKEIYNGNTFCNRKHMILYKRKLFNEYKNKTKVIIKLSDRTIIINNYSMNDIEKIKESYKRCILCHKELKKKNLLLNNNLIYGCCCYPCKFIYMDILKNRNRIEKYLNSCKSTSFNDKYYNYLIKVHNSKEYQEALNFNLFSK